MNPPTNGSVQLAEVLVRQADEQERHRPTVKIAPPRIVESRLARDVA